MWQERRHAPTEPEKSEIPERGRLKGPGGRSREVILGAAQRLFLERGFGAVTGYAR
jgi:hypothetical protein